MAKTPSRAPLIAAIVLVLAVLAGFNALNEKYRPKTEHELEAAAAEEAAKASTKAAENQVGKSGEDSKSITPVLAPKAGSAGSSSTALTQLGPDALIGDKNGKNTVTIGWAWTPEVQGDPSKVSRAIDIVKKVAPNAQIRVVNTDEVSGVSEGVSINGKVVVTPAPDGGFPADANAYQGVAFTLKPGANGAGAAP